MAIVKVKGKVNELLQDTKNVTFAEDLHLAVRYVLTEQKNFPHLFMLF